MGPCPNGQNGYNVSRVTKERRRKESEKRILEM